MSLTIQILIKNNENTLENCLKSIEPLNANIQVIDIGSNDNSTSICEKYKIYPIKKSLNNNYSKLRNENIEQKDWFMWLNPWEKIVSGWDEINLITSQKDFKKCFDFKTINKQIITREIRLWNTALNINFKNFVFESPNFEKSKLIEEAIIIQENHKLIFSETKEIIDFWKREKPLTSEPNYYEAYLMLMFGKYNEFHNLALHYLFNSKEDLSNLMLRYNLACVQIYNKNMINDGIKNLLKCLIKNPCMAEFWCLLGDAFYKMREFKKAISFYENAIIIGAKREFDYLPIDVSKYKEYPTKMIESCESLIGGTKLFSEMINK